MKIIIDELDNGFRPIVKTSKGLYICDRTYRNRNRAMNDAVQVEIEILVSGRMPKHIHNFTYECM